MCKICKKEIKGKRIYCSNNCKFSDVDYNKKRISVTKNPQDKIIKCVLCGWCSDDVINKSGILTKHSKTVHNKSMKIEDFLIVDKPQRDYLTCPLCNWKSIDINNKSGAFTNHLKNSHSLNVECFLKKYIQFNYLWKTQQKRISNISFVSESEKNRIECKICGGIFKKLTNTHLQIHNINPMDYKKKFNISSTCSLFTKIKQKKISSINQKAQVFDRIQANDCIPLFDEGEYKGVERHNTYLFKCKICNNVFQDILDDGKGPLCRVCNPKLKFHPNKKIENEIYEFLKQQGIKDIITNDRTVISPKEIDILIPSKKLAIELDGLYWHSEIYKDKNYHSDKSNLLKKHGYHTIHIFEDEWNNKKEIVCSRLKNILNITSDVIYARQCTIKEISGSICNPFLNKYHLQGAVTCKIKLGMFYKNDLIAVMTFSTPRLSLGYKTSNKFVELSRFATNGCSVVGGASKFLKYFTNQYTVKKIISYADIRWAREDKNLYQKIEFKLISKTLPGYFWCKGGKRYHRFKFTKSNLIKSGFDCKKTECEIMHENGYYRIWDCGHLRYEMTF